MHRGGLTGVRTGLGRAGLLGVQEEGQCLCTTYQHVAGLHIAINALQDEPLVAFDVPDFLQGRWEVEQCSGKLSLVLFLCALLVDSAYRERAAEEPKQVVQP